MLRSRLNEKISNFEFGSTLLLTQACNCSYIDE